MNISSSASIEDLSAVPSSFTLYPNFPNPFNSSTTIKYQLNKKSDVDLRILNIKGQSIEFLVNESQRPGIYSYIWNGKNYLGEEMPSGAYFLAISANNSYKTSKILLIK